MRELEELATRTKRIDSKYAAKDVSEEILRFAAKKRIAYEGSHKTR